MKNISKNKKGDFETIVRIAITLFAGLLFIGAVAYYIMKFA